MMKRESVKIRLKKQIGFIKAKRGHYSLQAAEQFSLSSLRRSCRESQRITLPARVEAAGRTP
jgi:hypothetical protein